MPSSDAVRSVGENDRHVPLTKSRRGQEVSVVHHSTRLHRKVGAAHAARDLEARLGGRAEQRGGEQQEARRLVVRCEPAQVVTRRCEPAIF